MCAEPPTATRPSRRSRLVSAPAQTGANLPVLKATHHHPSSTARSNERIALVSCEFLMLQEVPENGVTLSSLRVRYAPFGESPRVLPRSGSSLSQPLRESERLARDGDDDTAQRGAARQTGQAGPQGFGAASGPPCLARCSKLLVVLDDRRGRRGRLRHTHSNWQAGVSLCSALNSSAYA